MVQWHGSSCAVPCNRAFECGLWLCRVVAFVVAVGPWRLLLSVGTCYLEPKGRCSSVEEELHSKETQSCSNPRDLRKKMKACRVIPGLEIGESIIIRRFQNEAYD